MLLMDRGVVESPLQYHTIRKRPQAAVRRGGRLREQSVSIIDIAQRARAGSHGARVAMIRVP